MKRKVFLAVALLFAILSQPSALFAQTSSSASYQVNEATFASGGDVNANSASYNARGSAGNLGVGEAGSANFNAIAGSVTPSDEYLELAITSGTVNLGTLTTTSTGTGSATFYVRSYINGSYVVKSMSDSLTNGSKILTPMSAGGTSTQGTEQFGINLVANTSPATIGASPAQQPGSGFSNFASGVAATGYGTTNNYRYNAGDTIAQSGSGGLNWGQTNYTISYIANIGAATPGGIYSIDQDIVVIPTY